jgi:hypothetical protein
MERYLARLEADVRQLIKEGRTLQEAAREAGQSESAHWSLFTDFHGRNVTAAYQELEWSQ